MIISHNFNTDEISAHCVARMNESDFMRTGKIGTIKRALLSHGTQRPYATLSYTNQAMQIVTSLFGMRGVYDMVAADVINTVYANALLDRRGGPAGRTERPGLPHNENSADDVFSLMYSGQYDWVLVNSALGADHLFMYGTHNPVGDMNDALWYGGEINGVKVFLYINSEHLPYEDRIFCGVNGWFNTTDPEDTHFTIDTDRSDPERTVLRVYSDFEVHVDPSTMHVVDFKILKNI